MYVSMAMLYVAGEVWAVAVIDFETLNSDPDLSQLERELVIQARDTGSPARTASTIVTIVITDENDNPPVFSRGQYDTSVRENSVAGVELITVSNWMYVCVQYFTSMVLMLCYSCSINRVFC